MIHTPNLTSQLSELTSYVSYLAESPGHVLTFMEKIRTIELDGKTVKLQIVRHVALDTRKRSKNVG